MIMFLSCALTAMGLFLVSKTDSFIQLVFSVIPMGIGAGAVDACINNFVSKNMKLKHMIWLHGFWGIGPVMGPMILTVCQYFDKGWKYSSFLLSIIQITIAMFLLITLSFWSNEKEEDSTLIKTKGIDMISSNKGFIKRIIYMFLFSGFDITITLWLATYLTEMALSSIQNVGFIVSLYYGSVMVCRFIVGFIAKEYRVPKIINYSLLFVFLLTLLLRIVDNYIFLAVISIGLGLSISSLHPFTLYENHMIYTKDYASKITSFQIAAGLIGSLIVPAGVVLLMTYFGTEMFWYAEIVIACILIVFRYNLINQNII